MVLDTFHFVLLMMPSVRIFILKGKIKKLRLKACGKRNIAGAEMAASCVLPEHICRPRLGGGEKGRKRKTPREAKFQPFQTGCYPACGEQVREKRWGLFYGGLQASSSPA